MFTVTATIIVAVGLVFVILRKQYSLGMICLVTALIIYGFSIYVSQAGNMEVEVGSPRDNPEAYGTPAYRIVHRP